MSLKDEQKGMLKYPLVRSDDKKPFQSFRQILRFFRRSTKDWKWKINITSNSKTFIPYEEGKDVVEITV